MEGTSSAAVRTESRERTEWPSNSIFRAPAPIRSSSKSDFEPKLVSIGPYYHGREDLKLMEDLKHQSIIELRQKQTDHCEPLEAHHRNRSIYNVPVEPFTQGERDIDNVNLEQFMNSETFRKARAFYKHGVNHNPSEFVRMLVLDSCFIIRTIFTLSQQIQESMAFIDVNIKDVRSDLLLLENQIPLFFIMEVYDWLFHKMPPKKIPPFNVVLEPFICLDMPWKINHDAIDRRDHFREAAHLLDLYWRCSLSPKIFDDLYQGASPITAESDISTQEQSTLAEINLSNNALMVMPNATELQKVAGIEFEKFKDKCHLDVIFSNGIMRMPHLNIDSRQKTLLRNLIAFENCVLPRMRTISCYMKLMGALLDSGEDVNLLHKRGVIYNTLGSHEMAIAFFKDIGNFCFIDNNTNRFSGMYKDVKEYHNSSWNRRWASLRYNYFNSPWAVISVVANVILLILAVVDTFYNVRGYHYPNN